MDNIIEYVTTHQFTVGVVVFVAILLIYVMFKKLLKLALLLLLMFLAMCGYIYFKDPQKMSKNVVKETFEKAKQGTTQVVEKGKDVYGKGKAVAEKGVVFSKDLKEFMKESDGSTKK
jgi:ABC-type bacteriocin/lantibiotic exporter with double-glycine peptidase domain